MLQVEVVVGGEAPSDVIMHRTLAITSSEYYQRLIDIVQQEDQQ